MSCFYHLSVGQNVNENRDQTTDKEIYLHIIYNFMGIPYIGILRVVGTGVLGHLRVA